MIIIFKELKSEEYVLDLVFCFNFLVVSGRWVGGLVVGGFNKTRRWSEIVIWYLSPTS